LQYTLFPYGKVSFQSFEDNQGIAIIAATPGVNWFSIVAVPLVFQTAD